MKKSKKELPYIVPLLLVVILSLLCSVFCFQLMLIQGESMEPNYHSGQLCLLNKLEHEYQRGDCILFYSQELDCKLVKRIVALPGDTVQISNGELLVNGEPYCPYPSCPDIDPAGLAEEEIRIPEGEYFVLGDNFTLSRDSRYEDVGLVSSSDILGRII